MSGEKKVVECSNDIKAISVCLDTRRSDMDREIVLTMNQQNGPGTRPTQVGYVRDRANRRRWMACTPSSTMHPVTYEEAIHIMATQTMAGWAGAQTAAAYKKY